MNNSKTPSVQEINYVTKRAQQGASSKAIATELEFTCHIKRTEEFVTDMRERLKLPPEDADRVHETMTTRSKNFGATADVQSVTPPENEILSTIKAEIKADEIKKNAPAIAKDHAEAAEQEPKPAQVKIKPVQIKINFKQELVNACKKGEVYIHAGIGAVECLGVEKKTIAGFNMELFNLRQINVKTPATIAVDRKKLSTGVVRRPASAEVMDQILYKLEHGLSDIKSLPSPPKRAEFFKEYLNSPDITQVADFLCLVYGNSKAKPIGESGSIIITMGDKAISLIAEEYAIVKKMPLEKAWRLVSDKIGKTQVEPVYLDHSARPPDLQP